jgi:hypothetical protein
VLAMVLRDHVGISPLHNERRFNVVATCKSSLAAIVIPMARGTLAGSQTD